jgi:hypothetical protein
VEEIGDSAQKLFSGAKSAVDDISANVDLKGRVQKNPFGMVAAAIGVGYVLGGGLFTPMTGRLLRLGVRFAALPFVKEELFGIVESTLDSLTKGGSRS